MLMTCRNHSRTFDPKSGWCPDCLSDPEERHRQLVRRLEAILDDGVDLGQYESDESIADDSQIFVQDWANQRSEGV